MDWASLFNWLSAATSVVAAIFWFCSAAVTVPAMTFEEPDVNPFYGALKRASQLSGRGAAAAAVAAIFFALSLATTQATADASANWKRCFALLWSSFF
jgi:hypothetical protein